MGRTPCQPPLPLPPERGPGMLCPMATTVLLLDDPRPGVRRLTLNRPEKRNALSNELRGAILAALKDRPTAPSSSVTAAACATC